MLLQFQGLLMRVCDYQNKISIHQPPHNLSNFRYTSLLANVYQFICIPSAGYYLVDNSQQTDAYEQI